MKTFTTLFLSLTACIILTNCSNDNESFYTEAKDENPIDINDTPINQNPPIDTGSEIVYTDIEPDFRSYNIGAIYNLDLDNNGTIDFSLESVDVSVAILAKPNLNTNSVNGFAAVSGPFWSYILPLNKDRVISGIDGSYFYDSYECLLIMQSCYPISNSPYCSNGWEGKVDKYMGLRFLINEQTHYGWARLDVTNPTQWIIKDYAYNAAPGKPILAGQMN